MLVYQKIPSCKTRLGGYMHDREFNKSLIIVKASIPFKKDIMKDATTTRNVKEHHEASTSHASRRTSACHYCGKGHVTLRCKGKTQVQRENAKWIPMCSKPKLGKKYLQKT